MRVILTSTLLAAATPALANVPFIAGGTITSEYDSTVALMWEGEFGCTGTIVAADRVMTAAHCIEDGQPPSHIMIGEELGAGYLVPVRDGWMHPDYDFNAAFAADIAVLVLDEDVSLAAVPIDRTPAADLVNQDIVYAGYGDTQGTGGDGMRKAANATVTGLQGDVLVVEAGNGAACFGDSGGPLYREINGQLHVMGVVSFGYTDDCFDDGGNTRTDIYADWVLNSTGPGGSTGSVADNDDWYDEGDTGGWYDEGDTGGWYDDSEGEYGRGRGCSVVHVAPVPWMLGGLSVLVLAAVRRTRRQG